MTINGHDRRLLLPDTTRYDVLVNDNVTIASLISTSTNNFILFPIQSNIVTSVLLNTFLNENYLPFSASVTQSKKQKSKIT